MSIQTPALVSDGPRSAWLAGSFFWPISSPSLIRVQRDSDVGIYVLRRYVSGEMLYVT
jgi:hypothetical protein